MYRLIMTAAAAGAWLLAGHFGLLAILAYVWLSAMTTTNTAKSRSTETRLDNLITNPVSKFPGSITVTGQVSCQTLAASSNISSSGGITANGQVQAGTQFAVGGATYTATNANFNPPMGTPPGLSTDGNGGPYWGTGERGFINNLNSTVGSLISEMRSRGLIN